MKRASEKNKLTQKGRTFRITADFLMGTLKPRIVWNELFQALKEDKANPDFYTQQSYVFPDYYTQQSYVKPGFNPSKAVSTQTTIPAKLSVIKKREIETSCDHWASPREDT